MVKYPMKLKAAVFQNIWGGRRLIDEYGIETDKANAAEAWMLSCTPEGLSVVENGEYAGKTLLELFEADQLICGAGCAALDKFPVLIKFIDAARDLSVQVHPTDEYAKYIGEGDGKTECWYILDAVEGAQLIIGFKEKLSRSDFIDSIKNGNLTDYVQKFDVKKGDFFFIEAGTLHAICSGVLLAEVQQNSATTYRVFDYNRLENGKLRPLRVDDAVEVTKLEPYTHTVLPGEPEPVGEGALRTKLTESAYFSAFVLDVDGEANGHADERSFVSFLALEGEGKLGCAGRTLTFKKGESIFLPAGCGEFNLKGRLKLLETRM